MNETLGKLVNNLAAQGDDHFHHVKRHFTDPHQRALLLRKGVYLGKEAFYSSLTLTGISDADYNHA